MKSLILISLTTCILNANGLESFLAKEDTNHKEQKEEINYYLIKHERIEIKIKENNTPQANEKFDPNPQYGAGYYHTQANETVNNFKSEFYRSNQELKEMRKEKERKNIKRLEKLIYINFNLPYRYLKHGIIEKIIITFDIDEKNNISNIKFIQPSTYEDINKAFEEAIIKSSQEIPTPIKKETKKLYYEFDI
jgi:outer membrane biosynthesis protein TonB